MKERGQHEQDGQGDGVLEHHEGFPFRAARTALRRAVRAAPVFRSACGSQGGADRGDAIKGDGGERAVPFGDQRKEAGRLRLALDLSYERRVDCLSRRAAAGGDRAFGQDPGAESGQGGGGSHGQAQDPQGEPAEDGQRRGRVTGQGGVQALVPGEGPGADDAVSSASLWRRGLSRDARRRPVRDTTARRVARDVQQPDGSVACHLFPAWGESGVGGYRAFPVRLPSGVRYWTVLDAGWRVVEPADGFLLHMRLGRDLAESSTKAYAISLALFLDWCEGAGLAWPQAPRALGRFVHWLRFDDPARAGAPDFSRPVRGERRVNCVLAAVREFFRHAAAEGLVEPGVLRVLFEVADDRWLPAEARGEGMGRSRLRPRHRLREPERTVEGLGDEEVLGLLRACGNARDRFIVLALWRMGLRRGELTGLRGEDVHFVPDATRLGCGVKGPHVHVRRRDNPNGAAAKSPRPRAVPADWLVVQAYDQYMSDRDACPAARSCDFLLVNLYRGQAGAPMRPGALNDLLAALSRRAGLARQARPHLARHAFAANVAASGATLDEIKDLLGHSSFTASEVYLHPSPQRLREAVARVPVPRGGAHEVIR